VTALQIHPIELGQLPPDPLVSVIMANYNYGHFLSEAIASVQEQTYSRLELVVVDDGSTDNSRDVLAALARADSRVHIHHQPNAGQAAAWNLAFRHCRGDIVCLLDSDDRFHPNKHRQVVAAFSHRPRAGIACHRLRPVDCSGAVFGAPIPPDLDSGWLAERALRTAAWGHWPPSSGLCMRRDVASRLFPLPSHLRGGSAGAPDSYIQSAARFLTEVLAISEPLADYRFHASNGFASGRPTVRSLTMSQAAFAEVFRAVHAFVQAEIGDDIATRLSLDDFGEYWETSLALRIFEGTTDESLSDMPVHEMLMRVPNPRRRALWSILLRLPARASQFIVAHWWSTARWKRLSRPLTHVLGLR
jgi:glycosyltransferase involved in cell wall biosynthesis